MAQLSPAYRARSRTARAFATLLTLNLVIMLFPPIHLLMAGGNMTLALTYFLGAPIVLIISMFVLTAIDPNRRTEEEPA
jgi:Na+/melibiose symporter-like transporter